MSVKIDKDGRSVVLRNRAVVALLLLPVPKMGKRTEVDLATLTTGVASSSNRLVAKSSRLRDFKESRDNLDLVVEHSTCWCGPDHTRLPYGASTIVALATATQPSEGSVCTRSLDVEVASI